MDARNTNVPVSQFRITAWPGVLPAIRTIEAPVDVEYREGLRVYADSPYVLNDDRIEFGEGHTRRFTVPSELYLRQVLDVDLDDPEAILNFYNRFGMLGVWKVIYQPLHPLAAIVAAATTDAERASGVRTFEHVDEFRFHASGLRLAVEIYRLYTLGNLEVADWPLRTDSRWSGEWRYRIGLPRIDSGVDALRFLADATWKHLEPFHPWLAISAPVREGQDTTTLEPQDALWSPDLLNVLWLQFYNHVATGETYKRCQNESCGRMFVYQTSDRAKHGQRWTTGVMYCSDLCAKAQAQRAYRRRKGQKR